jgi:hypothetical protein
MLPQEFIAPRSSPLHKVYSSSSLRPWRSLRLGDKKIDHDFDNDNDNDYDYDNDYDND